MASDEHWSVTVSRHGEDIVTIETNMLAGREISHEDEEAIRAAAYSLLGFIGEGAPVEDGLDRVLRLLREPPDDLIWDAGAAVYEEDYRPDNNKAFLAAAGKASKHEGDCTNMPSTCFVCEADKVREIGRAACAAIADYLDQHARTALADEPPARKPLFEITRRDGKEPCGECHIQPGETCDICGASRAQPANAITEEPTRTDPIQRLDVLRQIEAAVRAYTVPFYQLHDGAHTWAEDGCLRCIAERQVRRDFLMRLLETSQQSIPSDEPPLSWDYRCARDAGSAHSCV